MHRILTGAKAKMLGVALAATLTWTSLLAQLKPDQAADVLLGSARRAYNEKNYPFAAGRFREFLTRFGNHKEANAARYGLALSLLEGPERDHNGAVEQLQVLSGIKDFTDHAKVLYYLGLAHRGLGLKELAQADAKPQEAPQRQAAARRRFEESAKQFAAAVAAFAARAKDPPAQATGLPPDQEWLARARCDLAEMLVRTLKPKEAQAALEPFLKSPHFSRSRYHALGLYYDGFASFLLKDYRAARASLSPLAPFRDPEFGIHARYLVARIHHLHDQRKEALDHYQGVLTDHARQKQAAIDALKQPENFKNDPEEKARLESLTRDPPPDPVARAFFYLAVMLYEDGRHAEALSRLDEFARLWPKSSLLADAQLRQGFCRVQLKQFPDAIRTLQPLADNEPRLADQALYWVARAQAGATDASNPQAFEQALKTALDTLRRAADRAQQLVATDPEARERRGEALLELAETQKRLKQFREAAGTYSQVLNEKCIPEREQEIVHRLATAWQLAGDCNESDKACVFFQQTYPKAALLPAVLYCHAENAYFVALAAEKNPNLPNRAQELARLYDEAAKRYQAVLEKFPAFASANLARYGLALASYHKGDLEKAQQTLESIPKEACAGELAQVPYLLADCLMRRLPAKVEASRQQLQRAADLLSTYVAAQPNDPQTADALLKLGLCHQQCVGLLEQPQQRAKSLGDARAAYENLMQRFPQHVHVAQAVFERARCLAQASDKASAVNELQRFANDPLKAAPVAPMALLQLSLLLREQGRAGDAANLLAQCRQQHEEAIKRDPQRADWVPVLQYQHGLALREAGKLPEARIIFDQVIRQYPARPEAAEAALRFGQSLQEEGLARMGTARKAQASAQKPDETAAAARMLDEGLRLVQEGVRYLESQAEQLAQKQPAAEVRARMLYETAWGYCVVADTEVANARSKLQQEAGKANPASAPAQIPLSAVPLQPAEQKVRTQYQTLISSFPDLVMAKIARFELAELLADRGENDAAIKLLHELLDRRPPPELADKAHIRLGGCYLGKKDPKNALSHFETVSQNPTNPLAGEGQYRAGECLLQMNRANDAVQHFAVFRDQAPFQNLPGLTDRALLRLGQAYASLQLWDQSRQAQELLVARFAASPWVHEARYGIGWAWQNQKQFDNAINAYMQVTAATASEIGAKAQLQIGLCRLEQKRPAEAASALLIVPFTYDYPEWNAVALCEAARAFTELKQSDQAERLLQRVIRDHPQSKWAGIARERLETLKKG
jgi:TolA-binding protein